MGSGQGGSCIQPGSWSRGCQSCSSSAQRSKSIARARYPSSSLGVVSRAQRGTGSALSPASSLLPRRATSGSQLQLKLPCLSDLPKEIGVLLFSGQTFVSLFPPIDHHGW